MTDRLRVEPGEVFIVGEKLFCVCGDCLRVVRVNKPVVGDLHLCVDRTGLR